MLFGFFVVCSIALAVATLLLLGVGGRLHHASLPAGVVGVVLATLGAGEIVTYVWAISSVPVEAAEVFLVCLGIAVTVARPHWNPVGQVFFTAFVGASLAYLAFAVDITVAGHLSIVGSLASLVLLVLETAALTLASSFAFETCDVLCRVAHDRSFPPFDPAYRPKVSLHIAAYNEPRTCSSRRSDRPRRSTTRTSRSSSWTTTPRTKRSGARSRSTAPAVATSASCTSTRGPASSRVRSTSHCRATATPMPRSWG